MDTITLLIVVAYYAQGGDSIVRHDSIYANTYEQVLCISHIYEDQKRTQQYLYFEDDMLIKYSDTKNFTDTLIYPSHEYLASSLDGFTEDKLVKWEVDVPSNGADVVSTFRMQSNYQVEDNPLGLDQNVPIDVTNYYMFQSIPDANKYNIPALRALGVVITWDLDDQNVPVVFSDFCTTTGILINGQVEVISNKQRSATVSEVVESSISKMMAELIEKL